MQKFFKTKTVGKMFDNKLLSLDNSGSGWDNDLLVEKLISGGGGGGVATKMSWYAFF